MKTELIIALNQETFLEVKEFVEKTDKVAHFFKIDAGLFTRYGPDIVKYLKDKNKNVFLDLKIHDIPSTASRAATSCIEMGVDIINLHALGGFEMMEEVIKASWQFIEEKRPLILGVTILTHIDEAAFQDLFGEPKYSLEEEIMLLAQLAKSAGLNGVVSSPQEIRRIKHDMGENFIVATPGIRLPGTEVDEHARSSTPREATIEGADFIIMGRPIYTAEDPVEVITMINHDIEQGLENKSEQKKGGNEWQI